LSNIHGRHGLLLHIIFQIFLQPTCIFRIVVTWRITCSSGWLVILILVPIWLKDVIIFASETPWEMSCSYRIFSLGLTLRVRWRCILTSALAEIADCPKRMWHCPIKSSLSDRSLIPALRWLQKLRPWNSTWDDSYDSGKNDRVWRLKIVFGLWYQRCQKRKSLTPPYCRHSIMKSLNLPR
jgi:hypothetical protein